MTVRRRTSTFLLALAGAVCGPYSAATQADPENKHVSDEAFVDWARENAVPVNTLNWREVDLGNLAVLEEALEGKRIVYLGEPDHYIREKHDFRLIFIRYLFEKGWRLIGMEMGRSDGKRIDRYLETGEATWLHRVATLGYSGDMRTDRRDTLPGLDGSGNPELWERVWGEGRWFQRQLRSLNESLPEEEPRLRWFGFDVDTRPGGGYVDAKELLEPRRSASIAQEILRRLERVAGESRAEEIQRLQGLMVFMERNRTELAERLGDADAEDLRRTIRSLCEGLVFIEACSAGLGSPEGTAGLREREECLARNMDEVLESLAPGDKIILLGHNMHLSKDSRVLQAGWTDSPRLKMWPSIGSHLARKLPGQVYSVWMLYDHGRHGILLANTIIEGQVASSPRGIEHLLAEAGSAFLLPLHTGDAREAYLDQMRDFRQNGRPASGILKRQADAIFFVAEVNPPGRQEGDDS